LILSGTRMRAGVTIVHQIKYDVPLFNLLVALVTATGSFLTYVITQLYPASPVLSGTVIFIATVSNVLVVYFSTEIKISSDSGSPRPPRRAADLRRD
jgi:hypothetical protein